MLSPAQIETRVRELLDRQSVTAPPVPVELIANSLGAEIRSEPFDGEVSGALYLHDGLRIIGINQSESLTRQRFTIAHEIAHLVLHDDPTGKERLHIDRSFVSEVPAQRNSRPYRRDTVSKLATDPLEIEANRFAAGLLMPLEFLFGDIKGMRVPVSGQDVEELASRYQVSQQALIFRLMNLGVPVETA